LLLILGENRRSALAVTKKTQEQTRISSDAALAGVLALLIDARESRVVTDKSVERTEVLLARAGLTIDDIAAVTGKKRDAVRMLLQRRKAK
jgi:antitoxin component HigA of HigAB toxin-antitoxin module